MNKKQAGRLGGLATVEKYGKEHMSTIGKKGAKSLHKKYKISPVGTSGYKLVERPTRSEAIPTRLLEDPHLDLEGEVYE